MKYKEKKDSILTQMCYYCPSKRNLLIIVDGFTTIFLKDTF